MALVNETQRLRDLDPAFLRRYDLVGPRYTSYPTAPEWTEGVNAEVFRNHLQRVKTDWQGRPLSIYLHIPFCEEHCTFCACNVIISPKGREVSEPYLADLQHEIEIQAGLNDPERPVIQFHWGGGTPTYLDCEQIRRTYAAVADRFNIVDGAEQSIEIHPPITTNEQLQTLAELGFNRLSMGVQDFNDRTQRAINRMQSYERTKEITDIARSLGFEGINYDLVYGLPYQTGETFSDTLDKVIAARPDRIALYNFAFLPDRLAHQRVLDPASLPSGEAKFRIFLEAHDRFRAAGYDYIGMDHFALPGDELSRALADGTLRRNFMGFTTKAGSDLIGMGVSAISSVAELYAQNEKKLTRYRAELHAGRLPTERGFILTKDDSIRRAAIEDIMCRNRVEKARFRRDFNISFDDYFREEQERLAPMIEDELLAITPEYLELTFLGRLFARNIAMLFDAHLQRKLGAGQQQRFSRTL